MCIKSPICFKLYVSEVSFNRAGGLVTGRAPKSTAPLNRLLPNGKRFYEPSIIFTNRISRSLPTSELSVTFIIRVRLARIPFPQTVAECLMAVSQPEMVLL